MPFLSNYHYFISFEFVKAFINHQNDLWAEKVWHNRCEDKRQLRVPCQKAKIVWSTFFDDEVKDLYAHGNLFYDNEDLAMELADGFWPSIEELSENFEGNDEVVLGNKEIYESVL